MRKIFKRIWVGFVTAVVLLTGGVSVLVSDTVLDEFESAPLLSDETRMITPLVEENVKTYQLEDGSTLIDTTIIEYQTNPMLRSSAGSNTVTRYKEKYDGSVFKWKITITATFSWKDGKSTCDSMNASYTLGANMSSYGFTQSSGNSSLGGLTKAYAKVDYDFRNTNSFGFMTYKFEITCTTTGTIADNG